MDSVSWTIVKRLEGDSYEAFADNEPFHSSADAWARMLTPGNPDPHFVFGHVNWDVMDLYGVNLRSGRARTPASSVRSLGVGDMT